MATNSKKYNSKQVFIDKLEAAIDAESTLSNCCNHLFVLMHEGKIRSEFKKFSDIAKDNIKILTDYLKEAGVQDFILEKKCEYCKINPESFSLEGSVKLGIEIIDACIKLYKKLEELSSETESKNLFQSLVKEKSNQKNFLNKEYETIEEIKESNSIIDLHCIPTVASRLGK
ncbi:MAG: hypothetical protein PHP17_05235 [Candidatus Omnitrophica bacterium]|nr:hypothetical protein [Candidatus Omnitrophota bacterium]